MMHQPFLTSWGSTATLTDVYQGFAKTPVDFVDGVIVTPITKVYRLVMGSESKERCPDPLTGRLLDLKNGKAILDVTAAELKRCCGPSDRIR